MRTMRCGQLQGELAAAALGLTRQPGAGGKGATRLTPLQQVTGGWHGMHCGYRFTTANYEAEHVASAARRTIPDQTA